VDPNFSNNHHVYLYYTFKKHGACPEKEPNNPVNRVSRFVMSGSRINPTREKRLIDNIPSPNGNHNAGDLHFGKDGYLYISVGDGGCDYAEPKKCQYDNDASRDRHVLLGKVLRITRNGGVPPDNPYMGSNSARCYDPAPGGNKTGHTARGKVCQETFAWGFRNPFRIAFDPDAQNTSFYVNDVGGQRWEEIDEGKTGADYGWNLCEGNHDNPYRGGKVNCSGATYTGPIHEYNHNTNCEAITGGAFVPNDGSWPDEYDSSYLFGDFVCNRIFELEFDNDGNVVGQSLFTTVSGGGPIAMTFGPYQTGEALYYTTFAGSGQVRRIAYTLGP
jgi:glucose/arabinose dehydrogenase